MDIKLETKRCALFVYDMSESVVRTGGHHYSPEAVKALPQLKHLIDVCHDFKVPVIHGISHPPRPGPSATKATSELTERNLDRVIKCPSSGGFYRSPLTGMLRRWKRNVLLIAGTTMHRGITTCAREAVLRGMRPVLIRDAIFGRDIPDLDGGTIAYEEVARVHFAAMAQYIARVATINEVVSELRNQTKSSTAREPRTITR
jgi:isochorismate hydrolase